MQRSTHKGMYKLIVKSKIVHKIRYVFKNSWVVIIMFEIFTYLCINKYLYCAVEPLFQGNRAFSLEVMK